MAGKTPQSYREVSPQDYIVAHQSSDSFAEVSEKTGLPAPICAARASYYRKRYGIELKKFTGGRGVPDVEELNELIAAMGGQPVVKVKAKPAQTDEDLARLERKVEERRKRNAELVDRLIGRKA